MLELKKLGQTTVNVGIQSDAGSDDEGLSIAQKAFYNEYGTKIDGVVHVPERSFLRSAYDENASDINTTIDRLWAGVHSEKVTAEQAGKILGERHQGQVKSKIRNGSFTPNAESTIARKGSSKPLIDTGEMLNSIRYEVK